MTLEDVLLRLGEFDEELTIYAVGGADASLSSEAVVAEEPEDGGIPADARGLEYLMGIYTTREVVEDWEKYRGAPLPVEEVHRVVMHYARYDAYPDQ